MDFFYGCVLGVGSKILRAHSRSGTFCPVSSLKAFCFAVSLRHPCRSATWMQSGSTPSVSPRLGSTVSRPVPANKERKGCWCTHP